MSFAEEKWNAFYKSGKISDYLSYKEIENSEVENADNNGGRGNKGTSDR